MTPHFAGYDFPVQFGMYSVSASGTSATVTASSTCYTNTGAACQMLVAGFTSVTATGTAGSVRIDIAYNDGTNACTATVVAAASANAVPTAPSSGVAVIRLGSGQVLKMVTNYPVALGGGIAFECRLAAMPISVS